MSSGLATHHLVTFPCMTKPSLTDHATVCVTSFRPDYLPGLIKQSFSTPSFDCSHWEKSEKYKKALKLTIVILGALEVCYIPLGAFATIAVRYLSKITLETMYIFSLL